MNQTKTKKHRIFAACIAAATAVLSAAVPPVYAAESDAVTAVSAGGWNEMLFAVFSGLTDADVTGVSYSGTASGTLTGDDLSYLVRDTDAGLRVDIPGLPAGTYDLSLTHQRGRSCRAASRSVHRIARAMRIFSIQKVSAPIRTAVC